MDFAGNCLDLSQFASESVAEIYASHVLEHLDYTKEAFTALAEFHRVLVPNGKVMIGVPDMDVLAHLFIAPFCSGDAKFFVMRMMFGGQTNLYDYHKAGYNFPFLHTFLERSGFNRIRKVESFGLFSDITEQSFGGVRISLNVEAFKPGPS